MDAFLSLTQPLSRHDNQATPTFLHHLATELAVCSDCFPLRLAPVSGVSGQRQSRSLLLLQLLLLDSTLLNVKLPQSRSLIIAEELNVNWGKRVRDNLREHEAPCC